MANPLLNEDKIYEKIKNNNITIHPLVWELMSHHVGNDLHIINLILGPAILPAKGDPKPISVEHAKKIYEKVLTVQKFMKKLSDATKKEKGF